MSIDNLPANIDNHNTHVQFGFTQEKINLFRDTFCKGCTHEEMNLFLYICSHTGLDPCTKQIYPVKRKTKQSDGSWKDTMTVQTGIDGFRLIADRTKKYVPGREPTFKYDNSGKIISATSYVKKQSGDGTWHEVAATAYFNEYVQRNGQGQPTKFWADMPHTMIAKCAEALALRKAFPAELSGIYTSDEMNQADSDLIDISNKAKILQQADYQDVTSISKESQKISNEEHNNLLDLIKQADDTCITNMCNWLKNTYKIEDYKDITPEIYPIVLNGLNKNIENNKKKQIA